MNANPRIFKSRTNESQLKTLINLGIFIFAWFFSSGAFSAPQISLEVLAEKEVLVINEKGEEQIKRITAETTVPGDTLIYTIRYKNSGDEAAKNIEVNNPIVEGTRYKGESAWGDNSSILFALDPESDFKQAAQLKSKRKFADGEVALAATPDEYKAIRWVISEIPAQSEGSVGFSVYVD